MLKIAIVEDDLETQESLKNHLHKFFNENKVVYTVDCFNNGIMFIDNYTCDYNLVFMDIQMPGMNGLEASESLRKIDKDVTLIFVTSLAQYAVKGYKVNAFDFIVKPFDYYDLNLTLLRALPMLKNADSSIIIDTNERKKVKILLDDLLYIEVVNHLLLFHTTKQLYKSYDTLKKYEECLKDKFFALCNRCYLVNLKNVKEVNQDKILIGNDTIFCSRPKRKEFLSKLNDYISSIG